MVDTTELIVFSTLIQTAVITLTLVIFILQFRSQEKAIRESSYQNLLGRYNNFIMSWQAADDILLARLMAPGPRLEPNEVSVIRRLMISYGIIEEAYELYKKKWIDEESWEQWNTWLKALCRHPHFATLHANTTGMYDKDFQAHVSRLLESRAA